VIEKLIEKIMVDAGDVLGGFVAGLVVADFVTIPYTASALYLSLRGRSYWKIPYAVPIKAMTKERVVTLPKFTLPVPRLQSVSPFRLSVSYVTFSSREIVLNPATNPLKFAILAPTLVPQFNRSLTLPVQCVIAFGFMLAFCAFQARKETEEGAKEQR